MAPELIALYRRLAELEMAALHATSPQALADLETLQIECLESIAATAAVKAA